MTANMLTISQGPSKYDLSLALFDRKPVNTRDVELKLEDDTVVHLVINGVEIEDGSGESWIFKGYLRRLRPRPGSDLPTVPAPPSNCFGYYRTDTRKGWLRLVD